MLTVALYGTCIPIAGCTAAFLYALASFLLYHKEKDPYKQLLRMAIQYNGLSATDPKCDAPLQGQVAIVTGATAGYSPFTLL